MKVSRSYKTLISVYPPSKYSGKRGIKTRLNFTTQIRNIYVVIPCLSVKYLKKKYTKNFYAARSVTLNNDMITELKLSAPFIWCLVQNQAAALASSTLQFGHKISTYSL